MNFNIFRRLYEGSAIDWLPIIFNAKKYFPRNPRPDNSRKLIIEAQLREIDANHIDIALEQFEKLSNEEEERRKQVEAKAANLIGFTAISSSFIVGFAQFLAGSNPAPQPFRTIIIILYILIAVSLLITVILAFRAIAISEFQIPWITNISTFKWNTSTINRKRVENLLFAWEGNKAATNDKATYVKGAEDWFRNTIYLLLVLMVTMAATIASNTTSQQQEEPIKVIILTPSTAPSTATSTVVPTNIPTSVVTSTATVSSTATIPPSATSLVQPTIISPATPTP